MALVCRITEVPMRHPLPLPLQDHLLVRQDVPPFYDVHLGQFACFRINIRHDLQQCIAIQFSLDNALDDAVELRTLYPLCLCDILDVLSFFIHSCQHVTVPQNLALQRFDDRTDMSVLLQTRLIQVYQSGPVVQDITCFRIPAARAVQVVPLDFPDILLYGLFRGFEYAFQQFSVKRMV